MGKTDYIRLTTYFFAVIQLISCNSECNKKAPQTPRYSQTIEDSKKNDVFKFEVVADKPELMLDTGIKLKVQEAWVENEWYTQNYVIGKTTKEKVDAYELIMKLNIDSSAHQGGNHFYYFIGLGKHLDTFIHLYCHRIDTINVPLFRETSDELPSKKERKAFDSLTFVKRKM